MGLRQTLANLWTRGRVALGHYLVGGALPRAKATDEAGWDFLLQAGDGPADRPWVDKREDLEDALEAWGKNFLIRQIVRLTTAYVVGDGIKISSSVPAVNKFITEFWSHEENHIGNRLSAWCDELTRAGELFPVLFTRKLSGMSEVRAVPASSIPRIETDPEDYEKELEYQEQRPGQLEPKVWKSKRTARVYPPRADNRQRKPDPVMLHYAVNRPVGATRGESDLTPILPWARRYTEWLKDRVEFNRLRNKLAGVDIEVDDDSQVEAKRKYYKTNPPGGGSFTVHGKGERITYPSANLQGIDAAPDGQALRLAFAAGANVPLHFLAEGSSATRSTATEMGDPTHRHYRMRQADFCGFLVDLCTQAWRRHEQVLGLAPLADLGIGYEAPDVSRADNKALAEAAKTIVEAFAAMKAQGWITDELAIRLSFKFAGEILEEDEIKKILAKAESEAQPGQEGKEDGRDESEDDDSD